MAVRGGLGLFRGKGEGWAPARVPHKEGCLTRVPQGCVASLAAGLQEWSFRVAGRSSGDYYVQPFVRVTVRVTVGGGGNRVY